MSLFRGKVWFRILCLVIFLPAYFWCAGQPVAGEGQIRRLTVDDGLPQGWVFNMVQDQQGYVWMGANGLYRYDGYTFKKYAHRNADTNTLAAGEILNIKIDDADNLLITFYSSEIDILNIKTGRVRHLTQEPHFSWLRDSSTYITKEGGKYFYNIRTDFGIFDLVSGSHQPIQMPPGEKVIGLGSDQHQQILISTQFALYRLIENRLQKIVAFPTLSPEDYSSWNIARQFGHEPVSKILVHESGRLVMAAFNGVFTYNPTTGKADYLFDKGSNKAVVYNICRATSGDIYFLKGRNIYRLDKQLQLSLYLATTDKNQLSEPLLADRSGMLWAATMDATGLRLINTQPGAFHSFYSKKSFVYEVLGPWLPDLENTTGYSSYGLRCAKDANGKIYFICPTVDRGATENEFYTNKILQLGNNSVKVVAVNLEYISGIAFSKTNQCWLVGSTTPGKWFIGRVNLENGTYQPIAAFDRKNWDNGFLTTVSSKIAQVEEYTISLYDTSTNKVTVFTNGELGVDNKILMAAPDNQNDSILWVATKGSGIVKLNIYTKQVTHFTVQNGLPDNTIYYLAADKKGFFWCSSNLGIFRFDPRNGRVESYTKQAGLQGNEFNRYHFLEMPDGHFAFGGTEGYTIFHPDSVRVDTFKPPVAISEIYVNNMPLEQVSATFQHTSVSALQQVTLPYNQNLLSISFAGLQYNSPDKTQYRYMLEGVDKGWVKAGMATRVSYTFAPGHYVFKVNAANTSGIWSNQVKTLEINILPPWWKTVWAYLIYVLITGGIIYGLYRGWLLRVKARQKFILQQKEAAQLRAMDEMKSRFFSNITHEFRTPLSLITAPLEEMQRNNLPPKLKPQIQGVQRNANQLLHLINQLLDMAKLEANSMSVDLQRGNLSVFVKDICDGFLPRAHTKQLLIDFESHLAPEKEFLFDADKLQKITTNLLSNAIKFTPAGGRISVAIDTNISTGEKTFVRLMITDTGMGIPPEKLPFVFNRFYQVDDSRTRAYEGTGIGLALVKELAELMEGSITATHNPTGSGTAFTLLLPLLSALGNETIAPAISTIDSAIMEGSPEIISPDDTSFKPLLLITEDHAELNAFIAGSFQNEYRVITAANGKQGLEMAQRELPDIIISDARMPEMDGYAFCKAVKQSPETSHIAFVLLTAKATQQSRMEGLQSQADDYITKPFHVEELQLRIRNILNRQQQLRTYYNRQLTAPEEKLPALKPEDPFLQELYNYVDANLDDTALNVEKLAVAVLVSQRTLSRKLNAIAGITPIELIKQYRLKKAAALLINGSTVSEAAFATGYDNPNYFSTAFKGFYKLSPTEYTKNQMKSA